MEILCEFMYFLSVPIWKDLCDYINIIFYFIFKFVLVADLVPWEVGSMTDDRNKVFLFHCCIPSPQDNTLHSVDA